MSDYKILGEILHDGVGCRPATNAELALWADNEALRSQVEQLQGRCAELEYSVTELIQHYSETWDLPILERAEAARDGQGKAWLLRQKAEAVEAAVKELMPASYGPPDDPSPEFNAACEMCSDFIDYAQRLRDQAGEIERGGGDV